jgi:hypothetical protein
MKAQLHQSVIDKRWTFADHQSRTDSVLSIQKGLDACLKQDISEMGGRQADT